MARNKPLFRITDATVILQYMLIQQAMRKHADTCVIAYQSNWNVVIACADVTAAAQMERTLFNLYQWDTEHAHGLKHHDRVYIRINFNR